MNTISLQRSNRANAPADAIKRSGGTAGSYGDLLDDAEVEGLIITTPNDANARPMGLKQVAFEPEADRFRSEGVFPRKWNFA